MMIHDAMNAASIQMQGQFQKGVNVVTYNGDKTKLEM